MGKRKRSFQAKSNQELFDELDYWMRGVERMTKDLMALWLSQTPDDFEWYDSGYAKNLLENIRRLHETIRAKLPTDKITVDPVRVTKKGHLNLHKEDIDYE
jgi:hypothetical protein